jgi:hypothetical protein
MICSMLRSLLVLYLNRPKGNFFCVAALSRARHRHMYMHRCLHDYMHSVDSIIYGVTIILDLFYSSYIRNVSDTFSHILLGSYLVIKWALSVHWNNGTLGTMPKELYPRQEARSSVGPAPQPATSSVRRPNAGYTPSSRGRSGLDQTWGPGSPRGGCPHIRSPLNSLAQMASEPTPDEGCDPVKLHGCDIGRSDKTTRSKVRLT